MTHNSERPRRRLGWKKKLAFSGIVTVGALLLLELALALAGIRPERQLRDPFVGFDRSVPLFVREGDDYVTNPVKLAFFNQQRFPARKASGAFRVFCLGGSTTFGHPLDNRQYYGTWLKTRLEIIAPETDWQIVNCGGISYASYRLALLTEELVNYEPDLFVIYTGHNEFLEERTYGHIRDQSPMSAAVLRVASFSRTVSLMRLWSESLRGPAAPSSQLSPEVNTVLEHTNGPETYHRSAELQDGVVEHFQFSLTKMCRLAKDAGARVILIQPASNLRDFSPFKSEHIDLTEAETRRWDSLIAAGRAALDAGDSGQAVSRFLEAEQIDPRHAEGLWLAGTALFTAKRHDEALQYFIRAKDEDVCPLRASSRIRESVFAVARSEQVEVIDFPKMLAEQCLREHGHEAVGLEYFLDHVHPNLQSHGALGRQLCETMARMQLVPKCEDTPELSDEVARRVLAKISPRDHVWAVHTLAMTLSWAGKNEEALRLAEVAAERLPDDSEVVSQYGRLLEKVGRTDEALSVLMKAAGLNPADPLTQSRLGSLYLGQGDTAQARQHLELAIQHAPAGAPLAFQAQLRSRLGDCYAAEGDEAAARKLYEEAARLDPHSIAHERLGK